MSLKRINLGERWRHRIRNRERGIRRHHKIAEGTPEREAFYYLAKVSLSRKRRNYIRLCGGIEKHDRIQWSLLAEVSLDFETAFKRLAARKR